jgi:PAS domain S-box-containing protein
MEESSGQYPLVNVNRGITRSSGQTGPPPQNSGEVGSPAQGMDFDPRNLIPVPIVFCDDEGQIVWLNTAAEDLTGFSSHHLVGKAFTELFPEEKRPTIGRRVLRWRRRGETQLYLEEPIQTAALKPHWIGVTVKRVPAPTGKEVYVCSLHDLQAMRDELESLRRQVSEMEARIDEAAASVELKSEFIRTISEDIRAPMSGVVGMSRFLLETELNPEQMTFAEVIENSGQQLLDVVDDLLDFSRIEAGELEIQSIDFDVRVAVEAVAVTLGTRATDRQLGFSFGVDRSVQSELIGDPGRFRQILLHLGETVIEEAKSGTVSLHVGLAEESARGLTLQVCIEMSEGPGEADSQENVFNLFSSDDSLGLRKLGSRGLGLNLCRQMLSLMRGEVIQTAGETLGLSFQVPFQKQVLPEITSAPEEISLEGAHVIVGDPMPENGSWLSDTLTGWGCAVTKASSGEEAIEALRNKAAAGFTRRVAIIDLDLPGISTEDLASTVCGDSSISDTPMVMITSIGRRGDAEMASGFGFRAYLTKPIEPVDLRECVIELLRTQHSEGDSPPLITRHLLAERRHVDQPGESVESDGVASPVDADKWTPPAEWATPLEVVAEAEPEAPAEAVTADEPAEWIEPEAPIEAVAPEEPKHVPEEIHTALKAKSEALSDLTQVLGLQATLAKGRLRKAVEIVNRREIEWEARSLDKMYGATGSEELSRQFRALAVLAGSGEPEEIQAKWTEIERLFEEGSPPVGVMRRAA